MILQQFNSGLGNQMFQYSFFLYLKERYPYEQILADLSWFGWHQGYQGFHQGYELQKLFRVNLPEAGFRDIVRVSGRVPQTFRGAYQLDRILRLFTDKHYAKYRLDEMEPDRKLEAGKNWYLTGYYISEKYYRNRLEELRKVFVFPEMEPSGLKDRIRTGQSVSIHVRRGDYSDPVYGGKFKLLAMDYYRKAAGLIREKAGDAEFFIFSDDKDYISEAFDWLEPKTVVSGNSGEDSWKDMYLMSLCRHNIIANSTFSTWGALLNANKDAMIIYPAEYMNGEDSEIKTIPGWIRI